MGTQWGTLGAQWGCSGVSWGPSGGAVGCVGGPVGVQWGALVPWASPGHPLSIPLASPGHPLGIPLASPWHPLGIPWASPWHPLGDIQEGSAAEAVAYKYISQLGDQNSLTRFVAQLNYIYMYNTTTGTNYFIHMFSNTNLK